MAVFRQEGRAGEVESSPLKGKMAKKLNATRWRNTDKGDNVRKYATAWGEAESALEKGGDASSEWGSLNRVRGEQRKC